MARHISRIKTLLLLISALSGCQKAPSIAPSAEPSSINAPAPMDSETSNAELLKRRASLDRLLDGQVTNDEFLGAKNLKAPQKEKADEGTRRLSDIITELDLQELPKKEALGSANREFITGQFYFYERRFVEASQIFSQILDKQPLWLRPRNLLARCFYFLGNTDRALLELQYVLTNHKGQAEELLDALFLMGAIAMDSSTATKEQQEKGAGAWRTYLKIAPTSPLHERIQDGLARFEEKKKQKSESPVVGDAKKEAIAALECDDLLLAENKIRSALKRFPKDDELAVALARVFVKSGRVQEALAEFKKVIGKNPNSVLAYHYQGMAFMMSSDPKAAIASWEKVMQLDKAYGERFNLSGRIAIAQSLLGKENK